MVKGLIEGGKRRGSSRGGLGWNEGRQDSEGMGEALVNIVNLGLQDAGWGKPGWKGQAVHSYIS